MRALVLLLVAIGSIAAAAEPAGLAVGEPVTIAPECVRDGALIQATPAAAFGKKVYLVAWSDGSRMLGRETADIYCARVEPGTGRGLDPKGIVVCKAENLQGRPAVAFDGTNFLVAWEDLRNGTDHDIYAARITEEGKVLDPDGFPIVKRPNNQAWPAVAFAAGNYLVAWMGDKDYWWHNLASRVCPAAASNGASVLLVYTKEYPFAGSGRPGLAATLVNAAAPTVAQPVKVAGGPSPAWAGKGWALGGPAWQSGWTPTPFLGAAFLPETPVEVSQVSHLYLADSGHVRNKDATPALGGEVRNKDATPGATADVVKAFGGGYNVGKGSTASFPSCTAFNGRSTLVAMQYAWREKGGDKRPVFAILALRVAAEGEFRVLDQTPVVVASATSPSCVGHPTLAAGPNGECLLVYEEDSDVKRCALLARVIGP